MALYVTSLEAFPTPIDVCPLLPMIGEVMLGNVNVCSYKIALEKVFKMESIVLKNQKKRQRQDYLPHFISLHFCG